MGQKPPFPWAMVVVVIGISLAFAALFSTSHRDVVKVECLVPVVNPPFTAGEHIWAPDVPVQASAWSLTPISGWQEYTCSGSTAQWKAGVKQ